MNQKMLNNELMLSYGDSFQEMDRNELTRLQGIDMAERFGIWDKGRHIMVIISWHEISGLARKLFSPLASPRELAERDEKIFRKKARSQNYRLEGFTSEKLCGMEAPGFRCTYEVSGVVQEARVQLLKHEMAGGKKTCTYHVDSYLRKELEGESTPVIDGILGSMRFA